MLTIYDAVILYLVILAAILSSIVIYSKIALTLLLNSAGKLADAKILKLRNVLRSLMANTVKKFNSMGGGTGGNDIFSLGAGLFANMMQQGGPIKRKQIQQQPPIQQIRKP